MIEIELKNWMCHRALKIGFTEPVGLIVGGNATGKTAFRDALEFVYLGTGELRGIPTKKEMGRLSISEGAKFCEVTVTTPRMRIRRRMVPDGTQSLWTRERDDPGSEWGMEAGVAPRRDGKSTLLSGLACDALRCAIDPLAFSGLSPSRRREILIGATTSKATTDEVQAALQEVLEPENDEDEKAILQVAEHVVRDGFRAAENAAVDLRKDAKRRLADIVPHEPHLGHLVADHQQILRSNTEEDIEARLKEVRQEIVALRVGSASSAAEIEGRLAEATEALEALQGGEPEGPDTGAAAELKDAATALSGAQEAKDVAGRKLEEVSGMVARLETRGPDPAQEFQKPVDCPAAGFDFKCPVKKATFEKHRPPSTYDPQAQLEELAEAKRKMKPLLETHQAATSQFQAAQDHHATVQRRADSEAAREERMARWLEKIGPARSRVQEIEGQLVEARAEDPAPEGDLEDLERRAELGEMLLKEKRAFTQAEEDYRRDTSAQHEQTMKIARWDAIATALKPEGIESKLGGGAREEFMEALGATGELAGAIELTPEFDLTVHMGGRDHHPLQLSTSQRFALGISIQNALATMMEFPVLLCDAIDLFDEGQKKAWAEFAQRMGPHYPGGVIGLATSDDPGSPPPGVETWWLTPGEETVLRHLVAEGTG